MFQKLRAFFNPEQFQGWGKTVNYFEGWYYKLINASETCALAIIPGIAFNKEGEGHSFIQILDGKKQSSAYLTFAPHDFLPESDRFQLSLHRNFFSESAIELNLPEITGKLNFADQVPWPKPFYSPGIMGPYRFAPFMECYHGIVSMDYSIQGELQINNEIVDFSGGRGYIEKDWGRSFPSAYVWMQSNHFSKPGISFKASVAKIPWIRNSFTGFIAGLYTGDRLIRFTTYNGTTLKQSLVSTGKVILVMQNKQFTLEINAIPDKASALVSPIHGAMEGKIEESMSSAIEVKLTERRTHRILFHDRGRNAGLEIAGNIDEIQVE